jgi:hypothetical protein
MLFALNLGIALIAQLWSRFDGRFLTHVFTISTQIPDSDNNDSLQTIINEDFAERASKVHEEPQPSQAYLESQVKHGFSQR